MASTSRGPVAGEDGLRGRADPRHRRGEHDPPDPRQGRRPALRPEGRPPPGAGRRHLHQSGPARVGRGPDARPSGPAEDPRLRAEEVVVQGHRRRAADGVRRGLDARRGRPAVDPRARRRLPPRGRRPGPHAPPGGLSRRPEAGQPAAHEGGKVKIIDFGTAWIKGEDKGRVQGTPQYMAPEQATKKVVDEKTDLYNFGATMYRMFTGEYANLGIPGLERAGSTGPGCSPPRRWSRTCPRR